MKPNPVSGPGLRTFRSGTRRAGVGSLLTAGCVLSAGCAGPAAPFPATHVPVAAAWQAPLPHDGSVAGLARWWAQFDDPALARLVDATQAASPTVASAAARIEQARATRSAAGAALLPGLDATASASRGRQDVSLPAGTLASAGLQASWEIDVFGRNRAGRDAAEARLEGAAASWHDARVAVAAETAGEYVALRGCEARLAQARLDATSRGETARLTDLSTRAGFESPANAALARASAAQARAIATQQAEACAQSVKTLVALTAVPEPELRTLLGGATSRLPEPAAIAVPSVPAAALAQRPDVHARGRDLVAASAEVRQSEAARWPRIVLAGSVGVARFESSLGSLDGSTWSLGPVSVSVPIFDAGTRRANVAAARARYDEAAALYAATLRGAIREVESALVALEGTAARGADAQVAAENFEASYRGVEARYRSGFASLFELEDARRNSLAAQNALIDLRRERVAAWIALYRALGGGWTGPDAPSPAAATEAAALQAATQMTPGTC